MSQKHSFHPLFIYQSITSFSRSHPCTSSTVKVTIESGLSSLKIWLFGWQPYLRSLRNRGENSGRRSSARPGRQGTAWSWRPCSALNPQVVSPQSRDIWGGQESHHWATSFLVWINHHLQSAFWFGSQAEPRVQANCSRRRLAGIEHHDIRQTVDQLPAIGDAVKRHTPDEEQNRPTARNTTEDRNEKTPCCGGGLERLSPIYKALQEKSESKRETWRGTEPEWKCLLFQCQVFSPKAVPVSSGRNQEEPPNTHRPRSIMVNH